MGSPPALLSPGHQLFSVWPRGVAPTGDDRIAAAIATSRRLIQADRSKETLDK